MGSHTRMGQSPSGHRRPNTNKEGSAFLVFPAEGGCLLSGAMTIMSQAEKSNWLDRAQVSRTLGKPVSGTQQHLKWKSHRGHTDQRKTKMLGPKALPTFTPEDKVEQGGYGVFIAESPACRVRVKTELFPSWCSR